MSFNLDFNVFQGHDVWTNWMVCMRILMQGLRAFINWIWYV